MFVPPTPGSTRSCSTQQSSSTTSSPPEQKQQQKQSDMTSSREAQEEEMPPPAARMVDRRRPGGEMEGEIVRECDGDDGVGSLAPADAHPNTKPSEEEESLRVPVAMAFNEEYFLSLGEAAQVLDGEDWRRKLSVLRQIRDQLATEEGELGEDEMRELATFMGSLAALCGALRDTRPEVPGGVRLTQLMCAVISGLAKAAGPRFCGSAAAIIPELLPFLSTPKEAVQQAVASSVEVMVAECHSSGVLRAATVPLVGSKKACSASLRRKGSGFLRVAIERWPQATLRATLPPIMRQMRDALFDTDATVRREGRHTFGVFIRLWPSEGGGMYHALDRANQRAVLQEQPHVSNFISSKAPTDGATAAATATSGAGDADAASGSSAAAAIANAATRVAMGGVLGGRGEGGSQRPSAVTRAHHLSLRQLKIEKAKRRLNQQRKQQRDDLRELRSSPPSAKEEKGEEEEEEGGERALSISEACAITPTDLTGVNASSPRAAIGGSFPPASPAAAATVVKAAAAAAAAAAASPIASPRVRPIVFFSSPRGGGGGAPGSASRAVAPSFFASPRGGRVAPGSASRAVGSSPKVFFSSPRNSTPGSASRVVAPSSSSSNGLRRAAKLALSKNDLMSPTLKRLLQEPSRLQSLAASSTAAAASGDLKREEGTGVSELESGGGSGEVAKVPEKVSSPSVTSPGSDESGLGEGHGGGGSGSDGSGGRLTPTELRRSMGDYGEHFETSPFAGDRSGGRAGVGADGFVSSCSSSSDATSSCSSSEDEHEDEGQGEKEKRGKTDGGETDCSLPTRVLFGHEQSPRGNAKASSAGTLSPTAATAAAATAAAAAVAATGAGRSAFHPTLEMKRPLPREPTKHAPSMMAAAAVGGAHSFTSCRKEMVSKSDGRVYATAQNSSTSLTSPRSLPFQVTPRKMGGILAARGGVGRGGGTGVEAISTAKRRVRFSMEDRGGGPLSAASLNSPCRSTGKGVGLPLGGGWWRRTGGGVGVAGSCDGVSDGDAGVEAPRSRSCRLLSLFARALLAVAMTVVGAAAFADRQGSNGGGFEAWRTFPPFSPVLPSLEQLAARHDLPTTPSVTPSVAAEGAKEEKEEKVVGFSSRGSENDVDFALLLSSPPLPLSESMVDVVEGSQGGRCEVATGAGGSILDEEEEEEQAQNEEEEEVAQEEEEEEEEDGSCTSELSGTDILDDVSGETSIPSTDTAGLPGSDDASNAATAAVAASTVGAEDGVQIAEGVDQRTKDTQSVEGVLRAGGVPPLEISPASVAATSTTIEATTINTAAATATATAGVSREKNTRRSSTSPSPWGRLQAVAISTKWSWSNAEAGSRATPASASKRGWLEAGATAPAEWGLLEAAAAVFGAVALMATVIFKSKSHEESGEASMGGPGEGGEGGEAAMSTPTGKGGAKAGSGGEEGELGSYSTVEMVKRGGTPATLRSVKRSRRISSSHKKPKSSMVVMDLGATALDLSNT